MKNSRCQPRAGPGASESIAESGAGRTGGSRPDLRASGTVPSEKHTPGARHRSVFAWPPRPGAHMRATPSARQAPALIDRWISHPPQATGAAHAPAPAPAPAPASSFLESYVADRRHLRPASATCVCRALLPHPRFENVLDSLSQFFRAIAHGQPRSVSHRIASDRIRSAGHRQQNEPV